MNDMSPVLGMGNTINHLLPMLLTLLRDTNPEVRLLLLLRWWWRLLLLFAMVRVVRFAFGVSRMKLRGEFRC